MADPELIFEKTPSTPGQGFPYLYLEPGIILNVRFATVTLDVSFPSVSLAVESLDENGVLC